MWCDRIARVTGSIFFLVAVLILCTAECFEPPPTLYRAKPEDVQLWAEQGNFRFIQLDGGQIETWKAQRAWWDKKFRANAKELLAHIYDRDFGT